jgi:hypothetical protein
MNSWPSSVETNSVRRTRTVERRLATPIEAQQVVHRAVGYNAEIALLGAKASLPFEKAVFISRFFPQPAVR